MGHEPKNEVNFVPLLQIVDLGRKGREGFHTKEQQSTCNTIIHDNNTVLQTEFIGSPSCPTITSMCSLSPVCCGFADGYGIWRLWILLCRLGIE